MKRLLIILAILVGALAVLAGIGASVSQAAPPEHQITWTLPPQFDSTVTSAQLQALVQTNHASMFPQSLGSPPCERWGQVDTYDAPSGLITADGTLSWVNGQPEDWSIYVTGSAYFVYGGDCGEEEEEEPSTTLPPPPPPCKAGDVDCLSTTIPDDEVPDLHVRFCHVGQGDIFSPDNYTTLVLPRQDAWSEEGGNPDLAHFYTNGNPLPGHEQDYYGACTVPKPQDSEPAVEDDFCTMPDGTVIEDDYVFGGEGSTFYTVSPCGPRPVEAATTTTVAVQGAVAPSQGTTGTPPAAALPATGFPTWLLATIAAILVGVGGSLVWTAHRPN